MQHLDRLQCSSQATTSPISSAFDSSCLNKYFTFLLSSCFKIEQFAKIVLHWISFMQGMCYSPSDNPCISKCSLISINQVIFCFLIINTRSSTGSCKISTSYTLPADKSHWTVFLTQVNTIHPDYLSGDQVTQQQKPKARKTLPEEPLCCHKNKLCLLNVICFLQVFTSC